MDEGFINVPSNGPVGLVKLPNGEEVRHQHCFLALNDRKYEMSITCVDPYSETPHRRRKVVGVNDSTTADYWLVCELKGTLCPAKDLKPALEIRRLTKKGVYVLVLQKWL